MPVDSITTCVTPIYRNHSFSSRRARVIVCYSRSSPCLSPVEIHCNALFVYIDAGATLVYVAKIVQPHSGRSLLSRLSRIQALYPFVTPSRRKAVTRKTKQSLPRVPPAPGVSIYRAQVSGSDYSTGSEPQWPLQPRPQLAAAEKITLFRPQFHPRL